MRAKRVAIHAKFFTWWQNYVSFQTMSFSAKYHIADGVRFLSDYLGIDPKPIIAQAGLPLDFLDGPEMRVTGPQFYKLWDGVADATPDPDLPKVLSDLVLYSELDSSGYAFFSSPTVRVGMQRKALFKPLVMPIRFEILDAPGEVAIVVSSPLPGYPLPDIIGWFDMVFSLAIARKASGVEIAPVRIEVAAPWARWSDAETYFDAPLVQTGRYALVLKSEDMDRPLVTRNDAGWADVASDLQKTCGASMIAGSTAERVRQTLLEGLPGGQAGADQISRRLGLSKRSLQRRLAEEGMQFKEILEDTRRALALTYLQRHELGMQEIALLLGFRDPSSFFRAFKGWTGQTPQTLRGTQ